MGGVGDHKWSILSSAPPPAIPVVGGGAAVEREEHWTQFDDSVNAVSFGFVATAILISMFLLMAIFERFLRSRSNSVRARMDVESQTMVVFNGKLGQSSPKMTIYTNGVSVLMPGEQIPTFIACPAPKPCPREPMSKPPHHNLSVNDIPN